MATTALRALVLGCASQSAGAFRASGMEQNMDSDSLVASALHHSGIGENMQELIKNAVEKRQRRVNASRSASAADTMTEGVVTWKKVLMSTSNKVANGAFGKVTFWKTDPNKCTIAQEAVIKEQTPKNPQDRTTAQCEVEAMRKMTEDYFPALWGYEMGYSHVNIIMEKLRWEMEDVILGKARRSNGTTFIYDNQHIGLWVYELLRGVRKLHQHGITHRDIKGPNIMITQGYHAKLVDVGLACQSKGSSMCREMCSWKAGTPTWMPPESHFPRLVGIGEGGDYWAIGILLGQLLTRSANWPPSVMNCATDTCLAAETAKLGRSAQKLQRTLPLTTNLLNRLLSMSPADRAVPDDVARKWALEEMKAPEYWLIYPDTRRPPAECKNYFA